MSHIIKVTNKNNFDIRDYFDGIPYTFAEDTPINVPLDAMEHIFGVHFPADEAILKSHEWRQEAFLAVSRRWGWNSHDQDKLAANRKTFNNIIFTPIIMQQVELVAKANDMPEPREQKSVSKGGKFKPRADAIDTAEETSEEEVG